MSPKNTSEVKTKRLSYFTQAAGVLFTVRFSLKITFYVLFLKHKLPLGCLAERLQLMSEEKCLRLQTRFTKRTEADQS